jgi:hypothetical protein
MDGTQLTEAQQQLADVVQNGIINVNDIVYIIYQILDINPQQQSAIMDEVRRLLRPGTQQTPIELDKQRQPIKNKSKKPSRASFYKNK